VVLTRRPQHVCNHAKTAMDARLTAAVPALKRLLETVVLRVKAMLAQHQCLAAFWIGAHGVRDSASWG
jgi:hypothetical protein